MSTDSLQRQELRKRLLELALRIAENQPGAPPKTSDVIASAEKLERYVTSED